MQQTQSIQNPQTQVANTSQLNDRDYLNMILTNEKNYSNNYSIALNEASNDQVYQTLKTIFDETQNSQRKLYNLMFKNGWYKLDAEQKQNLDQKHQQFTGYKQQI